MQSKGTRKKTRSLISDILLFLGAASVTAGVYMIFIPAGYIIGGLWAVGIAILLEFSGGNGSVD